MSFPSVSSIRTLKSYLFGDKSANKNSLPPNVKAKIIKAQQEAGLRESNGEFLSPVEQVQLLNPQPIINVDGDSGNFDAYFPLQGKPGVYFEFKGQFSGLPSSNIDSKSQQACNRGDLGNKVVAYVGSMLIGGQFIWSNVGTSFLNAAGQNRGLLQVTYGDVFNATTAAANAFVVDVGQFITDWSNNCESVDSAQAKKLGILLGSVFGGLGLLFISAGFCYYIRHSHGLSSQQTNGDSNEKLISQDTNPNKQYGTVN